MTLSSILGIVGSTAGLVGSGVLAVSLDRPLQIIRLHLDALDTTVQAAMGRGNVPVFKGFDEQHRKSNAASTNRVRAGVWILAAGFGLQIAAVLVK
jgi:hypothetical protein